MRFSRGVLVYLAAVWVLVALYPDPTVLVHSVAHTVDPREDPAAVAALAAKLPNDPRKIEAYVLDRQVPYAYDWQSAGVPWYFPTTREALRAGRGDCESRAIVLASILAAKGIPHELRMSFDHIWVDYPGKQANAMENAGVEFAGQRNGHFFIRWPSHFRLGQELRAQADIYVTPAPLARVLLLLAGLTAVAFVNVLARAVRGGAGEMLPGGRRVGTGRHGARRALRRPRFAALPRRV